VGDSAARDFVAEFARIRGSIASRERPEFLRIRLQRSQAHEAHHGSGPLHHHPACPARGERRRQRSSQSLARVSGRVAPVHDLAEVLGRIIAIARNREYLETSRYRFEPREPRVLKQASRAKNGCNGDVEKTLFDFE
jgi:hypothetical protein